jgi:hypothetical protein
VAETSRSSRAARSAISWLRISRPTPLIGAPGADAEFPLEKALWLAFPALKAQRIKVYGWVTAGFDFSTSNKSNIPESYAIVPNNLELDQAVVRIVTSSLQEKIGNAV